MLTQQEEELLTDFRKSLPGFQAGLSSLARECAKKSENYSGRTVLGADEQAISIKVLPSSVASR